MSFELFFDIFGVLLIIIIPLDVLASVFSNIYVYKKLGREFESTEYYRIGFSKQTWIIILAFELLIFAFLNFKYFNNTDFNIAIVNIVFFPFFVAYNFRYFKNIGNPSSLLYNDKGLIVIRPLGVFIFGAINFVGWDEIEKIVLHDNGRKVWLGALTNNNGKTLKFNYFKESHKEIEQIFKSRSLSVYEKKHR